MSTIKIISAVITMCLFYKNYNALAGPTQINVAEKPLQRSDNIYLTLLAIEDKLRNLENTLNMQCTTTISGKIDYYGRKIDNIERELSRFQVYMRMELEKISENISSKNFKDDITKDRIVRKIDTVYEKVNHRLSTVEGQIDLTSVKSQNGREMVITKLEKMEESLTIRDADMEAELADAVAAIDDLKSTCTSIEETIMNTTKESTKVLSKSNEKSIKKLYSHTMNFLENTNRTLIDSVLHLQHNITMLLNQTSNTSNLIKQAKDGLNEDLNAYANKMMDIYSELWKKSEIIGDTLLNLAKVSNLTRSEQQNGLRALMVQVGKKSGKQEVQSDSSFDNKKLQELSEKIDANFENVMLAQNLFLESCHRVQMDEAQLESQISMVLEKLIDIFENKTSVGPKDIEKLSQLIRTHDSSIRKNIYHITNNLLALMDTTTNGNIEIVDYINNQTSYLDIIISLLQDFDFSSQQIRSILESIQNFQQQLNTTTNNTRAQLTQINITNNFIMKLLNSSHVNNSEVNNAKLPLEFIKNIYHILTSIEMKINKSYLDYFLNKYNIDAIAHRFGKRLNSYIQSIENNDVQLSKNKTEHRPDQKILELILEIFSEVPTDKPADPYTIESNNTRQSNSEIESIVLICDGTTDQSKCDNVNNTKYTVLKQNETENNTTEEFLSNYIDLIDVRSNSNNVNCNKTSVKVELEDPNKSLPNYIYMNDVQSNNGNDNNSNCTLYVNVESTTTNAAEEHTDETYIRYTANNGEVSNPQQLIEQDFVEIMNMESSTMQSGTLESLTEYDLLTTIEPLEVTSLSRTEVYTTDKTEITTELESHSNLPDEDNILNISNKTSIIESSGTTG